MNGTFTLTGWPLAVAAGSALLAWVGSALLERRQPREPRRRALRLALLGLACAAIFLLAAGPLRSRQLQGGEAVLLTPGATARDLAAAAAAGLPAWAVPAAAGEPAPAPGAPLVPDAASLHRLHPEIGRLRLVGHGLAAWEAAEVALPVVASTPPALPVGVARVAWPRRVVLGEAFEVGGLATGIPPRGGTIRLVGGGVGEVVVRIPGGNAPFRLRARPRGAGHHLVELRLEAAGQRLQVEQLDVEVVREPPPAVLWLDAAPGAEAREVKRWLAAAGGALAWRAQMSRGVARDEVVGMDPLPAGPFTSAVLRRFDLVVVDARALAALGSGERAALTAAVREDGLGLLLRGSDSTALDSTGLGALGATFRAPALPGGGALAARIDWQDGASAPLVVPARELALGGTQLAFATDRTGRVLAAWQPLGRGAVGVSLLDESWRWVLAGHSEDHRRWWRQALATLARPAAPAARWEVASGPLLVGTPVTLTFNASGQPPVAMVRPPVGDPVTLALRQDPAALSRWSTTFWPRQPGWHLVGDGAAAVWAWVTPPERWTTWRLADRQRATAARVLGPLTVPAATAEPATRPVPVPRWPLFLLLVMSLAALWAEEHFGPRDAR